MARYPQEDLNYVKELLSSSFASHVQNEISDSQTFADEAHYKRLKVLHPHQGHSAHFSFVSQTGDAVAVYSSHQPLYVLPNVAGNFVSRFGSTRIRVRNRRIGIIGLYGKALSKECCYV